jgi:phosphate transport system substrate-binding protein
VAGKLSLQNNQVMKKEIFIILFIILVIISSCASKKRAQETINISGAWALYPMVVKWSEEYKKEHPEIRFNISAGGAGKGMADALAGTVDLGMFSRDISQEEKDKGVWWVSLTIDAVVPTISAGNPNLNNLKLYGLTREEFKSIFVDGTVKKWSEVLTNSDNGEIIVYTRSDACGAAETWAAYLGVKQENLDGIGIFGDPGLAQAVSKDPNGIGFNNTNYTYDIKTGKKRPGMEVMPIDINSNGVIDPEENFYDELNDLLKAVGNGIYPSPPARELYFVSKGKPNKKACLDFIRWTLTEGQKFVFEAGFVPLDQAVLNDQLNNLN